MSDSQFPRDWTEAWLNANQHRLSNPTKMERREEPAKTLVIWFETPKYLIDICTWDHASCLDIEALNKNTGKTDFIATGPCEDRIAFLRRLETFGQWLDASKKSWWRFW